jgi:hypothetical protein
MLLNPSALMPDILYQINLTNQKLQMFGKQEKSSEYINIAKLKVNLDDWLLNGKPIDAFSKSGLELKLVKEISSSVKIIEVKQSVLSFSKQSTKRFLLYYVENPGSVVLALFQFDEGVTDKVVILLT